jgi:hypothetical protein
MDLKIWIKKIPLAQVVFNILSLKEGYRGMFSKERHN